MVVVDVATGTDSSSPGAILHEGVGPFHPLLALYTEPDGTIRIGVGVTFSSYEFVLPNNQRLTDDEWIEQLDSETPPTLPTWLNGLMGQADSLGIEEALQQFYLPIIWPQS